MQRNRAVQRRHPAGPREDPGALGRGTLCVARPVTLLVPAAAAEDAAAEGTAEGDVATEEGKDKSAKPADDKTKTKEKSSKPSEDKAKAGSVNKAKSTDKESKKK